MEKDISAGKILSQDTEIRQGLTTTTKKIQEINIMFLVYADFHNKTVSLHGF